VQVREEEGMTKSPRLAAPSTDMTRQLKGQREALVESHSQTERRRRLFDSVLSNVTAGVIGLNSDGRIDFANRAAERLLDMGAGAVDGRRLPWPCRNSARCLTG
jgi:two-component system, NtrC family, nitrogen regulation sensor histidine kinase NtrY